MIKRIACGAAAVGFAVSLFASSPAHAACNNGSNYVAGDDPATTDVVEVSNGIQELPDGGWIYGEQNEAGTGGFAGIEGAHGYLEAGGDATSGGYVEGYQTESTVNGRLVVSDSPSLCLAVGDDEVTP